MTDMLGPEGQDRFGRKRFTGNSLIALPYDIKERERIQATVDTLAGQLQRFRFEGGAEAFRERTTIIPEFGVATVPISPGLLADLIIEQPELQGHVVARERYLYAPSPLAVTDITLNPLREMNVKPTPGGKEVKVAVLDTGYAAHPDFDGRQLVTGSAILGKDPTDIDGHGTHCLGLACGPKVPTDPTIDRYGIAWDSDILAIRVLIDRLTGTATPDTSVLLGMLAAKRQKAAIINLSLGSSVQLDEPYNLVFEIVARLLLDYDVLSIAAAGDSSGGRNPVEHPANCPSVMAVAALDHNFKAWKFSCVSLNDCSLVDIAAPGEGIRSSSLAKGYAYESGTSMAAAFVSGVAALRAGTDPLLRGRALWAKLINTTKKVSGAFESEVGAGMVQAP